MTRVKSKIKKFSTKNKYLFLSFMFVLTLLLINGIQSAYAYYYNNSGSLPILSNLIGDFDSGDGDINIIIFKENTVGGEDFVKTYAVPAVGYSFDVERTSCQAPSGQKVVCNKDDPNASCHYTFNEDTKEFDLTSNQKVTCKFYFTKDYDNDIELHIMLQDTNGTSEHESKMYREIENIPAYGFSYSGYKCDNGSTVEIDPETGKIKVLATQRDVCYAYYDGDLNAADIIANVYIQKTVGGAYTKVSSIPNAQKYILSTSQKSYCHTPEGAEIESMVPVYEGGFIDILNAEEKQICDIYLDIDTTPSN